jgi:hypothetical protein
MISLKDFMELVEYKICDGSEFLWKCYGHGARTMAYENELAGDAQVTIYVVFTPDNHAITEMQVWDGPNKREYRWIHPAFVEGYAQEAEQRGVDWKHSLDDRKFIDLDLPEDILEKANAVYNGVDYDTRIMIKLDLGHDDEHLLMTMAHEADMPLNQFVEKIIRDDILTKYGIEI